MEQSKSGTGGVFILFGVILAIASVVAFLWGTSYTGNWQNVANAGISSLMGKQDATYGMAKMAVSFSPFTLIAGIGLIIVGFVKK